MPMSAFMNATLGERSKKHTPEISSKLSTDDMNGS